MMSLALQAFVFFEGQFEGRGLFRRPEIRISPSRAPPK